MNNLNKVASDLIDYDSKMTSTHINPARFFHLNKQAFYWKRIVVSILIMVTCFITVLSSVYAEEGIEITLRNFFDISAFYGYSEYFPVVEKGVPVSRHILIVKSCHCLDDAKDKNDNAFYFYMVDHHKGMKALISTKELNPVEKLDEKTKQFIKSVKKEIKKDGGIEAIIKKFKKPPRLSGQHI